MKPPIAIEDALEEIRQMLIDEIFPNIESRQTIGEIKTYDFANGTPFIKVDENMNLAGIVKTYLICIDDYYLKYKADRKHVNRLIEEFTVEFKNLILRAPHLIGFAKMGRSGVPYRFSNELIPANQIYKNCVFTNRYSKDVVVNCEFINCHFMSDSLPF